MYISNEEERIKEGGKYIMNIEERIIEEEKNIRNEEIIKEERNTLEMKKRG